jgi:hypothetical protein
LAIDLYTYIQQNHEKIFQSQKSAAAAAEEERSIEM